VSTGSSVVSVAVRVRDAWTPRKANEAASNASNQPGAIRARSSPATAGPTIVASQTCALASEFAASRPSAPPISASIVYSPAVPQLASSDEPASSAT
jgi:hypothetical protein